MVADLRIVDKEGALHSTKTMGPKMTSFFTGIKKSSKGSIIKICCNKSVICMSKSAICKTAAKKILSREIPPATQASLQPE